MAPTCWLIPQMPVTAEARSWQAILDSHGWQQPSDLSLPGFASAGNSLGASQVPKAKGSGTKEAGIFTGACTQAEHPPHLCKACEGRLLGHTLNGPKAHGWGLLPP